MVWILLLLHLALQTEPQAPIGFELAPLGNSDLVVGPHDVGLLLDETGLFFSQQLTGEVVVHVSFINLVEGPGSRLLWDDPGLVTNSNCITKAFYNPVYKSAFSTGTLSSSVVYDSVPESTQKAILKAAAVSYAETIKARRRR